MDNVFKCNFLLKNSKTDPKFDELKLDGKLGYETKNFEHFSRVLRKR